MSRSNRKQLIDAEQFSLRFRLLMSYHDLTLREIAQHTDNAVSTVGTWKNGRVPSSPETLERLAALFGVRLAFLLYGRTEDEAPPHSDAASRILQDIDDLLFELESGPHAREPQADFHDRQTLEAAYFQRDSIENYLSAYLDRAQEEPGGLEHTWYQLRREFPLDLFSRLSRKS